MYDPPVDLLLFLLPVVLLGFGFARAKAQPGSIGVATEGPKTFSGMLADSVAGMAGALVPIVLRRFGLDRRGQPAVARFLAHQVQRVIAAVAAGAAGSARGSRRG